MLSQLINHQRERGGVSIHSCMAVERIEAFKERENGYEISVFFVTQKFNTKISYGKFQRTED
jgi:hypothetical protein